MYLGWQMRVGTHLICNRMWMWWLYFRIGKTKVVGIATSKLRCIGTIDPSVEVGICRGLVSGMSSGTESHDVRHAWWLPLDIAVW